MPYKHGSYVFVFKGAWVFLVQQWLTGFRLRPNFPPVFSINGTQQKNTSRSLFKTHELNVLTNWRLQWLHHLGTLDMNGQIHKYDLHPPLLRVSSKTWIIFNGWVGSGGLYIYISTIYTSYICWLRKWGSGKSSSGLENVLSRVHQLPWFPYIYIIGDKLINPIVGIYLPIIQI